MKKSAGSLGLPEGGLRLCRGTREGLEVFALGSDSAWGFDGQMVGEVSELEGPV